MTGKDERMLMEDVLSAIQEELPGTEVCKNKYNTMLDFGDVYVRINDNSTRWGGPSRYAKSVQIGFSNTLCTEYSNMRVRVFRVTSKVNAVAIGIVVRGMQEEAARVLAMVNEWSKQKVASKVANRALQDRWRSKLGDLGLHEDAVDVGVHVDKRVTYALRVSCDRQSTDFGMGALHLTIYNEEDLSKVLTTLAPYLRSGRNN